MVDILVDATKITEKTIFMNMYNVQQVMNQTKNKIFNTYNL